MRIDVASYIDLCERLQPETVVGLLAQRLGYLLIDAREYLRDELTEARAEIEVLNAWIRSEGDRGLTGR